MSRNEVKSIKVDLEDNISCTDFYKLHNEIWFDKTSDSTRYNYRFDLLELYYQMIVRCKNLIEIVDKDYYIVQPFQLLLGLFEAELKADIDTVDYQGTYLMFLRFLYSLIEKNHQALKDGLEVFSGDLLESVTEFNHLFKLRNSEGEFLFPLKNLVVIVTKNFEDNDSNLLALTFTVSLESGRIEDHDSSETDTDKEVESLNNIIKKYNIVYLDYILNKKARILGNSLWIENFIQNNVIAVATDDTILIRNTQEVYFKGDKDVKSENSSLPQSGYYVEYNIENKKITSLSEWIYTATTNEVFKFFEIVLNTEGYNIFMPDSLIVNPVENSFVGFANRFTMHDSKIIFDSFTDLDTTYKGFFECMLKVSQKKVSYVIRFNDLSFITLNQFVYYINVFKNNVYSIEFLKEITKLIKERCNNCLESLEKAFINVLIEQKPSFKVVNEIFYNYTIIKLNVLKKHSTGEFYVQALPQKSSLIAFNSELDLVNQLYKIKTGKDLINHNEYSYHTGIVQTQDEEVSVKVESKSYNNHDYNIRFMSDEMDDIIDKSEIIGATNKIMINNNLKEIIILPYAIGSIISNYFNILDASENGLSIDYLCEIDRNKEKLNKIIKLVKSSRALSSQSRKLFSCGQDDESVKFLILYKILSHLQKYKIGLDNYSDWVSLILDHHYIAPADLEEYKSEINAFFERCKLEINEKGTVVIPLNGVAHDPTLKNIYSDLIDKNGYRDNLALIFDSAKMNSMIIKKEDTFYLKGINGAENIIKKILFVTDIVMTGSAAVTTINDYLSGNSKSHDYFIKNDMIYIKDFDDILTCNMPELAIASIFCNDNLAKVDDEQPERKTILPVNIDNDISCVKFNTKKYIYEKTESNPIFQLCKKLYKSQENSHFICMIRYSNMPCKYLPYLTEKTRKHSFENLFIRRQVE